MIRPKTVQRENKQLTLELDPTTATPGLRDLNAWERMLADYSMTSVSIDVHPLTLLRPHLPPGVLPSNELNEAPHRSRVAFAGMAVARQRPATASGIVFMLLEDELGQVNLIVSPEIYERTARSSGASHCCSSAAASSGSRRTGTSSSTSLESLVRSPVACEQRRRCQLPAAHHFGHR